VINEASLAAVAAAQWTPQFIKPLYDSYCFAQIPRLVRGLFTPEAAGTLPHTLLGPLAGEYEQVILLFVDAFGWRFFRQYAEQFPFLQRIVQQGMVTQLTSQFPSTTAAHVTTIHTGLPVGQSGVYEWFYYEPLVDALIAPLLFSFAGDTHRNTLRSTGIAPARLYPQQTIYHDLQAQGVRSMIFQHQDYTPSPYSDVVFAGAQVTPYKTLPEALSTLGARLAAARERTYYYLYFDAIDSMGHRHSPESPQFAAEVWAFWTAVEHLLQPALAAQRARTLLLVTADHGQVALDPRRAIYVNRELPQLAGMLRRNSAGHVLAPAGACRDLFLHVQEERLAEAEALLRTHLAGRAEVYRVDHLLAEGFFGPPSDLLRGRVGNLVALPYEGEAVCWYEAGRFELTFWGAHGGLTRAEAETVLLAQAYGG
jgi:predicted AlkP superfamily pyrophosphatase or phosphodiesterase